MMIAMLLGWSKWRDISVFNFGFESYLLQGRVHKKTNLKRFTIVPLKGRFQSAYCGNMTEEKLAKASLFNDPTIGK